MQNPELQARYARMKEILRDLERVAVTFSAGTDSMFVLKVAADVLGAENVLAVTGDSPSLPRSELEAARRLADQVGVEHMIVETGEFADENYLANPENRCYYCKDTLYEDVERHLRGRGFTEILNGTNADDHSDYRPGLQAGREHAIRSPVAEAGLSKADVRVLSRELGLPTFDKPASPCLASRVQYGERITPEKLRMIETCESFLRELGLRECRVRHHQNLARIEVPAEEIGRLAEAELRERIVAHFREAGYQYVSLDLQGFRSGSMNEVIAFGKTQADS